MNRAESQGAIERAVAVLGLFTERDSQTLGVTEIARALGLPKAVVHRILASLRTTRLVELEDATRRYRLGPGVLRLGAAYLKRLDLRALAHRPMEQLSRATSETVTLSIRSGTSRSYVHQVLPETDVKMVVELGRPFPLHAGSSSKAFLAFIRHEELETYLASELEQLTSNTIVDPVRLRAELESIRRNGYATSRGERQADAASVAAPIRDVEGLPVAVFSICGPLERFSAKVSRAADLLLPVTRDLSTQLGYLGD